MERSAAVQRALEKVTESKKILDAVRNFEESETKIPVLPITPVSPWPDLNEAASFVIRFWGISDESPNVDFAKKVFLVKYPNSSAMTFNEGLWALVGTHDINVSSEGTFNLKSEIKEKFRK